MDVDEVHRARMLAIEPGADLRGVVLVEGTSDQAAVEALAARRGRDLATEGISVVPMGGARSIRQFIALFGPLGLDIRVAGLCDAGEEDDFRARSREGRSRLQTSIATVWSRWDSSSVSTISRTN